MTTKLDLSSVILNVLFIRVLHQIESFQIESGQLTTQKRFFDDTEWDYCINILLNNKMIMLNGPLYELTEGGRIFLQRVADLKFPKLTLKPVWE